MIAEAIAAWWYECVALYKSDQIDRDWAAYDAWSAAVSRWIDRMEPGPQPY